MLRDLAETLEQATPRQTEEEDSDSDDDDIEGILRHQSETGQISLPALKAYIRSGLQSHGTDVRFNDRDSFGDGDQSPIHLDHQGKQFYRELFRTGGDIRQLAALGCEPLSPFAKMCVTGAVHAVREMLQQLDDPLGFAPTKLIQALEKRETSMRLSPLLMIVPMGKSLQLPKTSLAQKQRQVAEILLEYGARPDAKDVCGKTVCHYGMDQEATAMTQYVADLCIVANQSSHFFNQKVVLHSLHNESMNGKIGIAKGYIVSTKRRAVLIMDTKKIVGIKPENILLQQPSKAPQELVKLYDAQDRLGEVCLLECVLKNCVDATQHLLGEHNARVDIEDWDGFSPLSMATIPADSPANEASRIISKYTAKKKRQREKNFSKEGSLSNTKV